MNDHNGVFDIKWISLAELITISSKDLNFVAIYPYKSRLPPANNAMAYHNFVSLITKNKTKRNMETTTKTSVTVEATVNAPVEKVWTYWSEPKHITKWCQASDDWHAPYAENDLKTGGLFKTTMAAKDGSFSFDFGGEYTDVRLHRLMAYKLGDGREVKVTFAGDGNNTKVTEIFDAETTHSVDQQRAGWQAILDNFKKYTESN
jgi:uncharacterized protein YndB with AHSA1/START domain